MKPPGSCYQVSDVIPLHHRSLPSYLLAEPVTKVKISSALKPRRTPSSQIEDHRTQEDAEECCQQRSVTSYPSTAPIMLTSPLPLNKSEHKVKVVF